MSCRSNPCAPPRWGWGAGQACSPTPRGGKFRLVSCFNCTVEKRRVFTEHYGAREAQNFEALPHGDEKEAVILMTPNHNHKEYIEAPAAAGKHVYCEKPIAHSMEPSRAIVDAAEGAGVKLAVGHSARRLAATSSRRSPRGGVARRGGR